MDKKGHCRPRWPWRDVGIRFATQRIQRPEISENGEPGQTWTHKLKVLADVGLVGKTTLLSVITSNYRDWGLSFLTNYRSNSKWFWPSGGSRTFLDWIEGASQGVGLGNPVPSSHRRTPCHHLACYWYVTAKDDPYEDYVQINKELETYNLRFFDGTSSDYRMANKKSQEKLKWLVRRNWAMMSWWTRQPDLPDSSFGASRFGQFIRSNSRS